MTHVEMRGFLRSLGSADEIRQYLGGLATQDIKEFARYLRVGRGKGVVGRVADKLWNEKCVSAALEGHPIR